MSNRPADSHAFLRALAQLIDPENRRMITGITLEARMYATPRLTVTEWLSKDHLSELEQVLTEYELHPKQAEGQTVSDGVLVAMVDGLPVFCSEKTGDAT